MVYHRKIRIVLRLPAGRFVNGGQIIQALIPGRCLGLQITQHIFESVFSNHQGEHVRYRRNARYRIAESGAQRPGQVLIGWIEFDLPWRRGPHDV